MAKSCVGWRLSPANTRRLPDVGTTLGQRRKRCADIVPTLGECLMFAGPYTRRSTARATTLLHYQFFTAMNRLEINILQLENSRLKTQGTAENVFVRNSTILLKLTVDSITRVSMI